MDKLWGGQVADIADRLNACIAVDSRMWYEDITGSMAHAKMLGKQGIIPADAAESILQGLAEIRQELEEEKLAIDMSAEDIHTFVEMELTKRIGAAGKMLHTARSRNDQVATDFRLYLRHETDNMIKAAAALVAALANKAEAYADAVMPGYTHMQRAQPVTLGHHLCAYAMMFTRDIGRLQDARKRMNQCPLGAGALAGTTFPIDRAFTAAELGFDGPILNSMDAVSDRDFCAELAAALSLTAMHLSRLAEELVLWSSMEFGFVRMGEGFVTGSSIMPQKKNPDMAELLRGKTGRVYGDLMTLLTMLKGLPLSYNKDMQEDKEAIFDAFDTVGLCLQVAAPMIDTLTANTENMRAAAGAGFINATDCADYLVGRGVPFREAYLITAKLVRDGVPLEKLSLEEYKKAHEAFDEGVYDAVDLDHCVQRRKLPVREQLQWLREFLKAF